MAKIKVGVIGAGNIGVVHALAYRDVPEAELWAIADTNSERLFEAQKRLEIPKAYTNYEDLLEDPEIEAVSICLPNFLHHRAACAALESGKHVLLEKPMAMNAKEAYEIVDCAKRNGKILMIGFSYRFRPEVITLKSWVEEGLLGEVYHAQSVILRRRGIPAMGSWFTTKAKSGGGALIDIGVHYLDLGMWLMGYPEPVSVSGFTFDKIATRKPYIYVDMWGEPVPGGPFDVDEYAISLVRFKNGAALWMESSWALNAQDDDRVQVFGDKAGAKITSREGLTLFGEFGGKIADIKPQIKPQSPGGIYREEVLHFLECIREGKEPMASGEHGLIVQKVIDAIYESGKQQEEIKIN